HALAALIAGRRGDIQDAARHLSAVPDTTGWVKQAGPQALHGPMLARAVTAEQDGGPDDAIAVLTQCLDPGLGKMMPMRHVLLPDLTRLALEVGDARLARAAADYARTAGRPVEYGEALENAAVLVAADRSEAAARKLAAEAVRQYARLGAQ